MITVETRVPVFHQQKDGVTLVGETVAPPLKVLSSGIEPGRVRVSVGEYCLTVLADDLVAAVNACRVNP